MISTVRPWRARAIGTELVVAFGVKARNGLVHDEDPAVPEDGAGECDALALAAREPRAALADDRRIAVWHAADELVDKSLAGGAAHVRVGRVGTPEANVRGDRGAEEVGVLGHERDEFSQRVLGQVADVVAMVLAATSQKRSSRCAAVDFPAPECPTSATVSPWGRPRSSRRSARCRTAGRSGSGRR